MIRLRTLSLIRIGVLLCIIFLICIYARRGSPNTLGQDVTSSAPFEILIPKTIHQLLLSMPGHSISSFEPNSHSISWQRSGWKVEYWSEDSCLELAQEINDTGIYSKAFRQLPTGVLKSDFCRYAIMYGKGGIYNDLDVHLIKPLPWRVMGPSKMGNEGPPSLIVGLEGDAATKGLPKSPQFVQWTIASAPFHPIFQDVLNRITDGTPSRLYQAGDKDIEIDVMSWTGPGVWTDAVLAYLECTDDQLKKIRDLKESIRIKDVLLLPKRSFAIIQGEDHTSPDILVKHYFSGTWKTCKKGWFSWVIPWGC